MIELSRISATQQMLYVTIDEKKLVNRLFSLKQKAAVYYERVKGNYRKIGYHWILSPITVAKLKLNIPITA